MDHVKLSTTQYDEAAMIRAGEAAEVLWSRAFAKCGATETDGFIPDGMPARLCPTRTNARVSALVRELLWTRVDGGWVMDWTDQISKEELTARREAGARRQQAFRDRPRTTKPATSVSNASRNALLTGQEVEVEVNAAAAASGDSPAHPDDAGQLPGPLEVLRSKLNARRLVVRWDKLDHHQAAQIEDLIATHGDEPLVKAAMASFQPGNPPAFAQAWIQTWAALPKPGDRLHLVSDPRCDLPGHNGTTRHCRECASEAKASR